MRIIVCMESRFEEAEAMVSASLSKWAAAVAHGNATNDWRGLSEVTRIEQVAIVDNLDDLDATMIRLIKRGWKPREIIALM